MNGYAESSRFADAYDQTYDVFLSHSFADAIFVYGVKKLLESHDVSVYVDWENDSGLDRRRVTKDTAALLRHRMKHSKSLLLATSENASNSKWMSWELGYFDGLKSRCAIFPTNPTQLEAHVFEGREYLGLYPYITKLEDRGGTERLWVIDEQGNYVRLDN